MINKIPHENSHFNSFYSQTLFEQLSCPTYYSSLNNIYMHIKIFYYITTENLETFK